MKIQEELKFVDETKKAREIGSGQPDEEKHGMEAEGQQQDGLRAASMDGSNGASASERRSSPYSKRNPHAQDKIPVTRFSNSHEVGKSSFGTVFRSQLDNSGEVVVKILSRYDEEICVSFRKEWKKLRDLRHDNVVRTMGYIQNESQREMGLVMESMRENLDALTMRQTLSFVQTLALARQMASGLKYLHNNGVVHGNLNPLNILLENHGTVAKLADVGFLGTRRLIERQVESGYKSLRYISPECMQDKMCTFASDMYSFALIVNSMLTFERPFKDIRNEALALKVVGEKIRPAITSDSVLGPVIRACFHSNPEKRPKIGDVADLLDHLYSVCTLTDKIRAQVE